MTYERKVDNDEIWDFIKKYSIEYKGFTPHAPLMAGIFGVTVQCIHQKLHMFEKKGLIKYLKKNKNNVAYIIIE